MTTPTKPPIITRYLTSEMRDEVERSDQPHAHARLAAFRQAQLEHGRDVRVRFTVPPSRLARIWAALKEGFRNE
jgi:hypothetical protein